MVDNTLNLIGDSFVVKATPTNGLTAIVGFTEQVLGETATRQLKREFSYTIDGINYSDWQDLSNANLSSIILGPSNDFNIHYRFTRIGTDDTGTITWNWTNIEAVQQVAICGEFFKKSPFAFFFNCCCDPEILNWCVNVLGKIYNNGIVSKTLVRGQNQNQNDEDRDYIDFWRSITCFYALIVAYGRKYESFYTNETLLKKYLINRDISVSNDEDLTVFHGRMSNFYKNILNRGTVADESEIKSLISYNENKDQYLSYTDISGWVLNKTTPLYKQDISIIKFDQYPTLNVTILNDEYTLTNIIGSISGFTKTPLSWNDGFNIDPLLSYKLSFLVKATDTTSQLKVQVYGWNAAGNPINPLTLNLGAAINTPISNLTFLNQDYYQVEIILHNYNSPFNNSDEYTKCFGGYNMKLFEQISRIFVEIINDNQLGTTTGDLTIKNIELSTIGLNDMLHVGPQYIRNKFLKNNSGLYTDEDVFQALRQKHTSYREGLKIQ